MEQLFYVMFIQLNLPEFPPPTVSTTLVKCWWMQRLQRKSGFTNKTFEWLKWHNYIAAKVLYHPTFLKRSQSRSSYLFYTLISYRLMFHLAISHFFKNSNPKYQEVCKIKINYCNRLHYFK
jgi:hypothetical protein